MDGGGCGAAARTRTAKPDPARADELSHTVGANQLFERLDLVGAPDELDAVRALCRGPLRIGAMVETPRAALLAGELARHADFLSFGTNDLTQLTFGFSRDDVGRLLERYLGDGLLPVDPFASLDADGVGELVSLAVARARSAHPGVSIGLCGEHGADPASLRFLLGAGVDYVSCSPFRVPVARLAAAQAVLGE